MKERGRKRTRSLVLPANNEYGLVGIRGVGFNILKIEGVWEKKVSLVDLGGWVV